VRGACREFPAERRSHSENYDLKVEVTPASLMRSHHGIVVQQRVKTI